VSIPNVHGLVSATLEDEADVTGENEATCVWF
jgi:hypothetical protein